MMIEKADSTLALELINDAPYVFFQLDPKGNFTFVNNTVKTLTGKKPQELIGKTFTEVVCTEEQEKVWNFVSNLFSNKSKIITCEFKIVEGKRWAYQTLSAYFNDKDEIIYYNGYLRDITEAKEKELNKADNSNYGFNLMFQKWQLQKTNKILSTLQELNSEYILYTDKDRFYGKLLDIIINYSESKLGFIGEVYTENNKNHLNIKAFKNLDLESTENAKKLIYHIEQQALVNQNTFSLPLHTIEPIIENNFQQNPANNALLEHFPNLTYYMGIPLIFGNEIMGIIGIANKKEAYQFSDFELLEPVISNLSVILKSIKSEREKQKNENELKQVQVLLQEASNAMHDGVIITKSNGEILHSNQAATHILGLNLDQLNGKAPIENSWEIINSENSLNIFQNPLSDVKSEHAKKLVFDMAELNSAVSNKKVFAIKKSSQEELKWISINKALIKNAQERDQKYVYTFQDITEIKNAANLILESEIRYKNLFDNFSLGIFTADENGIIISINRTLLDLLEYDKEELIGQHFSSLIQDDDHHTLFHNLFGKIGNNVVSAQENPLIIKTKSNTGILVKFSINSYIKKEKKNFIVIIEDIRQKEEAEKAKKELSEKETLLKEIHHRVKNNLQIVSSLLNLQKSQFKDPEVLEKFKESQHRIKSIALIHENLYKSSDLSAINFSGYVKVLINDLIQNLASRQKINLIYDIQDQLNLTIDQCVPCGLIINEVITNVIKYAFNNHESPVLEVKLLNENGQYQLILKDNGCGFDYDEKLKNNSLGLKLVNSLSRQLNGNFVFENQKGTCFKLNFKPNIVS